MVGSELDCPLCDRAELPEGLQPARTAGPFDADSLPAAMRTEHRVGAGTWGVLRVLAGSICFAMATDPPIVRRLAAGDHQNLPPGVRHALTVDGPVRLAVDFLVRPTAEPGPEPTP